jgi:hypothetical protein
MKKLLLILFCFISLTVFSQNPSKVYEMLFEHSGQQTWYYTKKSKLGKAFIALCFNSSVNFK